MEENLIQLLKTAFGYPVRLQGSLAPNEAYPESFFTFWNASTDDGNHYDNDPASFVWDFDVNFYSTDPALVSSTIDAVRTLLRSHGWIVPGRGYGVGSDEPTHTGRGINALYFEINTGGNNNE